MEFIIKIFVAVYIVLFSIGMLAGLYEIGKPRKPLTPAAWLIGAIMGCIIVMLLWGAYLNGA